MQYCVELHYLYILKIPYKKSHLIQLKVKQCKNFMAYGATFCITYITDYLEDKVAVWEYNANMN